ncbi:MAG: tyrosine-type recombinase/integrase [bacterium]|nr:tyrosine-type recombinase/integrase [Gammaproteobacteria bacterium]MCP4935212.1 tyrosine-type recombinase/integrase [bacterium]
MAKQYSTPPRGFTDKFIDSLSPPSSRIELPDKATPGLRLRVSPTGTRTFIWRYADYGKSKVLTLGTYSSGEGGMTLKKARDALQKAKAAHKEGVSLSTPIDTPKTVKELGELFFERRILPHRKVPEAVRVVLDRDIYPVIGNRKLTTLTAPTLAHVVEKVVDRGASTYAGKVLQVLKQMFRFAEGRGYIDHSPAYALDKKDLGCVDNMKDRYLDTDEIRIVWNTIDKAPLLSIQARIGLKILLLTGVRTAELQLAEWKHISFKKAEWFIPEENSKTTAWTVPLSPAVIELLSILKDAVDGSPWVMASPKSKDGRLTSKVFGRAARRLFNLKDETGNPLMDIPAWSPHDLRRTMRTHMDDLHIEPHIAEKCLNHSLGRIEKTYNRNDLLDKRREALEKWADFVDLVVHDRNNVALISENRGGA